MVALASRRIAAVGVLLSGLAHGIGAISEGAANTIPDLDAAIARVLAQPKPGDRLQGLAEIAKNVALKEIPGALQTRQKLRQLREQAVFEGALLKRWSELAPREAFAHIGALPESRIKVEGIRFAAGKFAAQNCQQAAQAVQALKPGRSQNEAVDMVAGIWARQSVKDALQWANTLSNGFARETALNSIRFVWVHSDPVSAAGHVQELPAGDVKNALLTNIAGEWAALDPPAALRWANSLRNRPERDLVIANIAESWADTNPAAAGAFTLTLPGDLKQRAAAGVISRWATQSPEAAMNWALQTGDEAIQTRAFSEVLNLWASLDAAKAGEWVEKLAAGPAREAAIRNYVEGVITWEPSQALRLASRLKDESMRIEQVEKCLQRWIELDKWSARKWIATSVLPQDVKQKWIGEEEQELLGPVKVSEK